MARIKIKDIIIDSLKYAASDVKILLLLGIVLVIADIGDELSYLGSLTIPVKLILSSVVILIVIFEAGYVFRILEETVQGSNTLPELTDFKGMFMHGLTEMFLILIYFVAPVVMVLVIFLNFVASSDFDYLTGLFFIIIIGFALTIFTLFPAVMLHRANQNSDLRSSFDLIAIYHKIRNVGLKRLIIVYFTIFVLVAIIREALVPSMNGLVPFFVGIISDLIIAPYLVIFAARILGLLDN